MTDHYFDRAGTPIDLMRWADLSDDPDYRFVARALVTAPDGQPVALFVMWRGFDPYRGDAAADMPNIFEVTLWRLTESDGIRLRMDGPDDTRTWEIPSGGTFEAPTEAVAISLHRVLCDRVRRGEAWT